MSSWCATLPYALMSSSLYHPVGSRMILNSRSLMFSRASRTAAPSEGLPAAAWREREREGWCHSLEGREGGGGRRAASLTGVSTGSGTGSAAAITCGFSVGTDTEAAAGSGTSCHPAAACALPFEESGEQRGSTYSGGKIKTNDTLCVRPAGVSAARCSGQVTTHRRCGPHRGSRRGPSRSPRR